MGGEFGVEGHPHLPAPGEHVDRAVVIVGQEGPVRRWGLRELVDLLAQGRDVLAGLAQGEGEPLVLRNGLLELALGLEQLLFEGAHPLGRVLHPPAEAEDLLLEHRRLVAELRHLAFVSV